MTVLIILNTNDFFAENKTIFLFIVGFALIVGFVRQKLRLKNGRRNMRSVAAHFGIRTPEVKSEMLTSGYPSFSGKYHGIAIELNVHSNQYSRNRSMIYTGVYTTNNDERGWNFNISKERNTSPIGKFFGKQDIITGHEEFDKTFILQSTLGDKVVELFDDELCRIFLDSKKLFISPVQYSEKGFSYSERGLIRNSRDVERWIAIIEIFCKAGERIGRSKRSGTASKRHSQ